MSSNVVVLVENDTQPELQVTYDDTDLTGYLSIELHIAYRPTALVKTATMTDAVNGGFKFTWVAGDLRPGSWPAEIQLTDSSGGIITFNGLTLEVSGEIA